MDIKKIAAGAATAGVLGLGGLALGTGIAQADPHGPGPRPPIPGQSDDADHGGNWGNWGHWGDTDDWGDDGPNAGDQGPGQWPPRVTGPGVNAGEPGNPLPPGQGFLPPPGHGGPMPQDRIPYPDIPDWVNNPVTPPPGTPPAPPLPDWAGYVPNAAVVWNADLNAWGVFDTQTHTFIRL